MHRGKLVRFGPKSKVLSPPFDDYTDLLLEVRAGDGDRLAGARTRNTAHGKRRQLRQREAGGLRLAS